VKPGPSSPSFSSLAHWTRKILLLLLAVAALHIQSDEDRCIIDSVPDFDNIALFFSLQRTQIFWVGGGARLSAGSRGAIFASTGGMLWFPM
jgi:hypothetical protein